MPNIDSALHLSPCARRVLLVGPAIPVVAALAPAATFAPIFTAASLGAATPVAPTATDVTAFASTTMGAELTAVLMAAPPLLTETVRFDDLFGIGAARTDNAQRGGHKCSTGELYRPTPRDHAGVQTHRQVVQRAPPTSFISFRQQRDSSLPHHAPQQFCLHSE